MSNHKIRIVYSPLHLRDFDDYDDQSLIQYADFCIIYEFIFRNRRNLAEATGSDEFRVYHDLF